MAGRGGKVEPLEPTTAQVPSHSSGFRVVVVLSWLLLLVFVFARIFKQRKKSLIKCGHQGEE